ncbi:PREDICTED: cleavage and polyadenylation specificity factor subunit 3-II-like [Lupinus angustifolius]|uniref:cleavage and polyadenylation specificity factor subunit 3-II-like n=1 Tax=Lupinus angustifolius TaxID=3871 RepID=UPI00092E9D94|nr:PREDICTED: cleavage and polyadenylation specificity factor subunit 3-II-like [Lupinus angustifolius]
MEEKDLRLSVHKIGHKLLSGKLTKSDLGPDSEKDIHCQVHQLAFSPHTDCKGIMDLVKFLSPKHVMLVHGEKPKMISLKEKIHSELGIPCYYPANNETVRIPSTHYENVETSDSFVRSCSNPNFKFQKCSSLDTCNSTLSDRNLMPELQVKDERVAEGILVVDRNKKAKIVHKDELLLTLSEK